MEAQQYRRGAWLTMLATAWLMAGTVGAEVRPEPDVAEPGSIEAIASWTTDPRFVSPWVAYVPEAIPLLQTWNGTGPYNPDLDPIVLAEFLEMSFHEVADRRISWLGARRSWL